nr:MAG TPA: hypothetical protein [Caudoviricetes sp.]
MNQINETKDLLHEQVQDALNGIDVTDIASEESAKAVENSIKLVDREIEMTKIQNDYEAKLAQVEADKEVKLQQINEDKKSRWIDRIVDMGKFAVGLAVTAAVSTFAYKQEQEGNIVTTQQGRRETKGISVMDFLHRKK